MWIDIRRDAVRGLICSSMIEFYSCRVGLNRGNTEADGIYLFTLSSTIIQGA